MPNYCDNFVKIEHKNKTAIDRVEKAFKAGKLCNEFAPIPEELANTTSPNNDPDAQKLVEKYGYSNWYDFRVAEWGTKWDIGEDEDVANFSDNRQEKSITLTFQSAWSPPIALFQKMAEQGYDITAYYYEPGCAFTGKYTSADGDECYEIPETAKEVRDAIPEDIDDMFFISEQKQLDEDELENLMGGE